LLDSLYFDLIVTTIALHFQALEEKDDPVAEDDPAKTHSRDHVEAVVDAELTKIENENLTTSECRDAAKTTTGATLDDAE
jgi:hypothetical protein